MANCGVFIIQAMLDTMSLFSGCNIQFEFDILLFIKKTNLRYVNKQQRRCIETKQVFEYLKKIGYFETCR